MPSRRALLWPPGRKRISARRRTLKRVVPCEGAGDQRPDCRTGSRDFVRMPRNINLPYTACALAPRCMALRSRFAHSWDFPASASELLAGPGLLAETTRARGCCALSGKTCPRVSSTRIEPWDDDARTLSLSGTFPSPPCCRPYFYASPIREQATTHVEATQPQELLSARVWAWDAV